MTKAQKLPEEILALCTASNVERLNAVVEYIDRIDTGYDGLSLEASAKVYLHELQVVNEFRNLVLAMSMIVRGEPLIKEQRLLFNHPVRLLEGVRDAAECLSREVYSQGDKRSLRANIIDPVQEAIKKVLRADGKAMRSWASAEQQRAIGEWVERTSKLSFSGAGRNGMQATLKYVVEALSEQGFLGSTKEDALQAAEEAITRCKCHFRQDRRL
jgi:hypothetical protein